ncbi:MAG: hypothetical protein EXQ99_08125 [Alphaproteobacteria bacterium]|nr:hypothetical protein [Alphaproteobacteria bacterium]
MIGLSFRLGVLVAAFAVTFGMGARSDAAEGGATGHVSVEIRNMRVEKPASVYRFVHDRAFVEQGGVGVTLTQGQVCFSSGQCDGKPVQYRIEAKKEFVFFNAKLVPLGAEEIFAYSYTGKDDNGHAVYVLFRVAVSGDKYKVMP